MEIIIVSDSLGAMWLAHVVFGEKKWTMREFEFGQRKRDFSRDLGNRYEMMNKRVGHVIGNGRTTMVRLKRYVLDLGYWCECGVTDKYEQTEPVTDMIMGLTRHRDRI